MNAFWMDQCDHNQNSKADSNTTSRDRETFKTENNEGGKKGVKCLGLQLSEQRQHNEAKPVQHVTCNHPKFPTTPHPTWAGVPVKPTPCKPKSKRMAPSKHLPLNEKPIRLPIPFLLAVSIPPATCPHRLPKTWLFYMFVQEAMQ